MGSEVSARDEPLVRLQLEITGAVQGVGFRPFVYRLAHELGLAGTVLNDTRGVEIAVEGTAAAVAEFRRRVEVESPPLARIHRVTATDVPTTGESGFRIVHSSTRGERRAFVLPDVATCPDCLAEVLDRSDRR